MCLHINHSAKIMGVLAVLTKVYDFPNCAYVFNGLVSNHTILAICPLPGPPNELPPPKIEIKCMLL